VLREYLDRDEPPSPRFLATSHGVRVYFLERDADDGRLGMGFDLVGGVKQQQDFDGYGTLERS
jgi:hypothetical protein